MKIRDVRNEMAALEVEWVYFKQSLTAGLAKAFAPEMNSLLNTLTDFNNWFVKNLPEITDKVVKFLEPILKSLKPLGKDLIGLFKEMGVAFTQLMAAWDNDRSLDGATFSFEKFGKAVQSSVKQLAELLDDLVKIETWMLRHKGFLGGAYAGTKVENPYVAAGLMAGGALFDIEQDDSDKVPWRGWGEEFNQPQGFARDKRMLHHLMGGDDKSVVSDTSSPVSGAHASLDAVMPALFKVESNNNPGAVSPKGAMGLGQLMPGTARDMGVTNPFDPKQNAAGSRKYMEQLTKHSGGDVHTALMMYWAGPGNVDRWLKRGTSSPRDAQTYATAQAYAAKVEHHISVGDLHVTVNMPHGSNGRDVVSTLGATARNVVHAQLTNSYAGG
jgi:hypothetical protein